MSSTVDKVKNALHLNKDHSDHTSTTHTHNTTTGTGNGVPEGTAGPHTSRVANAADPRVDSDLDSSRRTGAGVGGGVTGTQHSTTGGLTGNHGTTGGLTGNHGTTGGLTGNNHGTAGGLGNTTGYGSSTTTHGPHSTDTANKLG